MDINKGTNSGKDPMQADFRSPCNSFCCGLTCPSSLDSIAYSQAQVAQCEADLFCTIASRLRCEIQHTCCKHDLERLVNLTNRFLNASAIKEDAIGVVIDSLHTKEIPLA